MRGSRANQTVCWSVYCGSHTFSRLSGFSAASESLSIFFRPVGGWSRPTRITSNLRRDCEAIVLKRLDGNPTGSLGLTLFLPSPFQPPLQGLNERRGQTKGSSLLNEGVNEGRRGQRNEGVKSAVDLWGFGKVLSPACPVPCGLSTRVPTTMS